MTAVPPEAVVEVRELHFRWPGQDEDQLDVPELRVERGERLFIHGASGSGKTTFLSLLGGIVLPSAGSVEILGQDTRRLDGPRRDRLRADNVGFVFQMFNLIPYLSLVDNVTLPCHFSTARRERLRPGGSADAEARRLLAALEIDVDALGARAVNRLSVGQQQRVAVARALIGSPPLIVADEPTSSLDADARDAFLTLLFAGAADAAVVFVSHDRSLGRHFDRTVALSDISRLS